MKEFKYSIDRSLDKETLTDLISDAMETGESGIGFWGLEAGTKEKGAWKKAREELVAEKETEEIYYCEIFLQVLNDGATIIIEDVYEEDGPWELTWEKLEKGCALYEEKFGNISREMEEGGWDALCAQLVFQLALFGEEVDA